MQHQTSKITFKITAVLMLFGLGACNPVGSDIGEVALKSNEIASAEGIDLKKGDVVTIWSKVSTSGETVSPRLSLRYSIENNDELLKNDSVKVSGGKHIINSQKSEESYQTNSSTDKDSTVYYTKWEYEAESASFTVPRDGKYNFDFKLKNAGDGFLNDEVAVILRKKGR